MVVAGCVRAVDEILQAKALPTFLLAAMATTSEGVVLPVGGIIWSHPGKNLNLQGQIQVKRLSSLGDGSIECCSPLEASSWSPCLRHHGRLRAMAVSDLWAC